MNQSSCPLCSAMSVHIAYEHGRMGVRRVEQASRKLQEASPDSPEDRTDR